MAVQDDLVLDIKPFTMVRLLYCANIHLGSGICTQTDCSILSHTQLTID